MWTGEVRLIESALDKPKSWRKPRRVLVPSMGDLFAEAVPDEFVARVFAKMARWKQHTYLVLTKRPERLLAWLPNVLTGPIPNIVLGCTVEDQKRASERLSVLAEIATLGWRTWISVEPLLGPVSWIMHHGGRRPEFVAVGGETGAGARPCKTAWIRSVVVQCQANGVGCHVKQLGKGVGFNAEDWPRDLVRHA
jgi:protein gp37